MQMLAYDPNKRQKKVRKVVRYCLIGVIMLIAIALGKSFDPKKVTGGMILSFCGFTLVMRELIKYERERPY